MKNQARTILVVTLILLGISSGSLMAKRKPAQVPTDNYNSPFIYKIDAKIQAKEAAREAAINSDLPKPTETYLVDNFQDKTLKAWWGFGDLSFEVMDNSVGQFEPTMAGQSVHFFGKTSNWGVGGCGRYIGLNANQFNCMKLMLKGNAKSGESGTLIVETYVAQDNKWMSPDAQRREYALKYECKFSHTIQINWHGWKLVTIPFSNFIADSPRIKKHFWDAQKQVATGTIVQIQFIVLAPQEKGSVDFQVSSIAFAKDPNLKPSSDILDY